MPRARATSDKPRAVQLATLVDAAPDGDGWLHERKFDGYRIVADKDGGRVRLWSRRFHDWTDKLPGVAAAVAALPARRLLLDGEVCVLRADGTTSFQDLQGSFGERGRAHVYFAFDVLAIDELDVTGEPLERRKQRLAALIARAPAAATTAIRYSDHVIGGGPAFFTAACAIGLEGIVSKRRDQPYAPGRGPGWLKTKCIQRQELVIGGFTEPDGAAGRGLRALLVGHHDGDALIYAGKVGTGFTAKSLDELRAALDPLIVAASPFSPAPARAATGPRVRWVRPVLVAEIAFSEWTADGRLRHPSFKGLRADKAPREITRERPGPTPPASSRPAAARGARRASGGHRPRGPGRQASKAS